MDSRKYIAIKNRGDAVLKVQGAAFVHGSFLRIDWLQAYAAKVDIATTNRTLEDVQKEVDIEIRCRMRFNRWNRMSSVLKRGEASPSQP